MKSILIIGADSFTGKHLTSYLKGSGYNIYGSSLNGDNNLFKCDITKKEDLINLFNSVKPDFLINLSAISFAAHGKVDDFYRVNTIGTLNILDTLIESKIVPLKTILVSSATVYGNQGIEMLDESLCPKPANHYGASKYSMECLVSNYFSKLPIIITRPFNYTGVGQAEHFLIPKIVKHFKEKREYIELGNLNVSREFNDISFVCEAYKRLLESNYKSEIVNIASNRAIKLLDVISLMEKIANYEINIEVNPAFIRKDDIKKLTGSNKKLFNIVGEIKQKEFENTLKQMYEA